MWESGGTVPCNLRLSVWWTTGQLHVFATSSRGKYSHSVQAVEQDRTLTRSAVSVMKNIRGSFQKFCALYVFSLKMTLFYKIYLQAFNVISIVLYHRGPTFGKFLYSCLDAFVFDASDYSGHLIRHLLNASEAFPTEWFLQLWDQVKV
jgi:hypothetical protein